MYQVGGVLLSKNKHRGNRVTIHEEAGKRVVLKLKYEGREEHRFGPMHKYLVAEVLTLRVKNGGRR